MLNEDEQIASDILHNLNKIILRAEQVSEKKIPYFVQLVYCILNTL
jgi:hypothetical protein